MTSLLPPHPGLLPKWLLLVKPFPHCQDSQLILMLRYQGFRHLGCKQRTSLQYLSIYSPCLFGSLLVQVILRCGQCFSRHPPIRSHLWYMDLLVLCDPPVRRLPHLRPNCLSISTLDLSGCMESFYERVDRLWIHLLGQGAGGTGGRSHREFVVDANAVGLVCQLKTLRREGFIYRMSSI